VAYETIRYLLNDYRLGRTALRGVLGAGNIFLARDFRFALVVQFESIGTEGHASAATDASLMIDFYHNKRLIY